MISLLTIFPTTQATTLDPYISQTYQEYGIDHGGQNDAKWN